MSRLIYDIETNGLLPELHTVHCIVTRDIDTGIVRCYYDVPLDCPEYPPAGTVREGVVALEMAAFRCGHYVQGFDEPALERLYKLTRSYDATKVLDTKVTASVLWPEEHLKSMDFVRAATTKCALPKEQFGRQSLEAWGHRLGVQKGDYGKQTDAWDKLTPEMLRYCVQDTRVTLDLYKLLTKHIAAGKVSMRALSLENEFAWRVQEQELNGFEFSVQAATALSAELLARRAELTDDLAKTIPPWVETITYVTPKRQETKTKVKTTIFNPGSDRHIARHLQERFGWKPAEFTPTGLAKTGDEIIAALPYEGIDGLREYAKIDKVLGMLSEGTKAWLKLVKPDGRIHGRVGHNAAVTGRCTHSSPNVTQVPRVKKDKATGLPVKGWRGGYGYQCRSLFRPRQGWIEVGCDASGLELRMLAHYMAAYDGGEYAKVVCEGDVHMRNTQAAGLSDREIGKRFIYAFLYGAGDAKLAKVLSTNTAGAKKVRANFMAALPALRRVLYAVKAAARSRKALALPDGRLVHVRAEHAALNTLLQGTGAIVMKLACVLVHRRLATEGITQYGQCHFAHDELQFECAPEVKDQVVAALEWSIAEAGRQLKLRCPLAAEAKVGACWAECH